MWNLSIFLLYQARKTLNWENNSLLRTFTTPIASKFLITSPWSTLHSF
jgi:hypothetical protein